MSKTKDKLLKWGLFLNGIYTSPVARFATKKAAGERQGMEIANGIQAVVLPV